jgi:hypothetical protein|tara:strand:- start:33 stop:524 length:492 start_codon:yes stop_codon:yes gene_type:complete
METIENTDNTRCVRCKGKIGYRYRKEGIVVCEKCNPNKSPYQVGRAKVSEKDGRIYEGLRKQFLGAHLDDINIIDRTNDYHIDDTILNLAEEFEERDKEARREHENKRVYDALVTMHEAIIENKGESSSTQRYHRLKEVPENLRDTAGKFMLSMKGWGWQKRN